VRFISKPHSGEPFLQLDRHDPLPSRWQYGLGRSAVFASDAKTPLGGRLGVLERLRQVLDQSVPRSASRAPKAVKRLCNTTAPMGIWWSSIAWAGAFQSRIRSPTSTPRTGRVSPAGSGEEGRGGYLPRDAFPSARGKDCSACAPPRESRAFRKAGLYRPEPSWPIMDRTRHLLRSKWPPSLEVASSRSVRSLFRRWPLHRVLLQLWPGLLGLAVVLSLAELVLRKWKGVMSRE
jgi:hypothetical protein